jgi:hypothetical protein
MGQTERVSYIALFKIHADKGPTSGPEAVPGLAGPSASVHVALLGTN